MDLPSFLKTEITVGEKEHQDETTLSFSVWKASFLRLSNLLLTALSVFDSEESYYDFQVKPTESDKIRLFFFAGLLDRSKRYLPIYALLLFLFTSDVFNWLTISTNLQIYGLVLDVFGAVFLAVGLLRGARGIERDTSSTSTGAQLSGSTWKNNGSLSAVVRNTVDGGWGTLFLISGFVIQIMAVSSIV